MKLKDRYPNASNFFISFIESKPRGFTDEEVIEDRLMHYYQSDNEVEYLKKVNQEIDALILNIDADFPDLIENSDKLFYNPSEAVAWLKMIRILLEKSSYNNIFLIK